MRPRAEPRQDAFGSAFYLVVPVGGRQPERLRLHLGTTAGLAAGSSGSRYHGWTKDQQLVMQGFASGAKRQSSNFFARTIPSIFLARWNSQYKAIVANSTFTAFQVFPSGTSCGMMLSSTDGECRLKARAKCPHCNRESANSRFCTNLGCGKRLDAPAQLFARTRAARIGPIGPKPHPEPGAPGAVQ